MTPLRKWAHSWVHLLFNPVPAVIELRASGLVGQTPSAQYAGAPMSGAKRQCTAAQDINAEFLPPCARVRETSKIRIW